MATKEQTLPLPRAGLASTATFPPKTQTHSTSAGDPERAQFLTQDAYPSIKAVAAADTAESRLFRVVELPRFVFSAISRIEPEERIIEACGGSSPLPFLLKGRRLYTFSPITANSVFAPALNAERAPSRERFADWLSHPVRSHWTIDLLNRFLRLHAWKRGLRYDENHDLFYFTRSRPKKLWWEANGKIALREVIAPNLKRYELKDGREVEYQCGWKHEAIRAGFARCGGELAVRFEPAWFLTKLDGKTAATPAPVVALGCHRSDPNGEELSRTLRFWCAVFAKGHRELRIETGADPIRVRLIAPPNSAPRIISKEDATLDYLSLTSMEDDGAIPELGSLEIL
jgi:hypothetical protein